MRKKQDVVLASDEAERGVLGRLIADDQHFYEYSSKLREQDFSDERNRRIYAAIRKMADLGLEITRPALVSDLAENDPEIPAYLAALVVGAAAKGKLGALIDTISRLSARREIIRAAESAKEQALKADSSTSLEEIRQKAISAIQDAQEGYAKEPKSLFEVVEGIIQDADKARISGEPIGIRSGLDAFDKLAGSLQGGQLIIVGGETGSGKTSLAWEIGYLLAEQKVPVQIQSLEMDDEEIGKRTLAAQASVDSDRIQEGLLTKEEIDKLSKAATDKIYGLPIWIDEEPKQSISTIQARFARAQIKKGLRLGIIDHLQFISDENPSWKENERIEARVNGAKAMAKRLGIPIILVSHVSRKVDWRTIRSAGDIQRPVLSDLYGSSAIEKAADIVVFVHRPIYFLERVSPPDEWRDRWSVDKLNWQGKAELVMPKRRSGKGFGAQVCFFNEKKTWFSDKEDSDYVRSATPKYSSQEISGHDYGPAPWDD